jgi:hypothetical protein
MDETKGKINGQRGRKYHLYLAKRKSEEKKSTKQPTLKGTLKVYSLK